MAIIFIFVAYYRVRPYKLLLPSQLSPMPAKLNAEGPSQLSHNIEPGTFSVIFLYITITYKGRGDDLIYLICTYTYLLKGFIRAEERDNFFFAPLSDFFPSGSVSWYFSQPAPAPIIFFSSSAGNKSMRPLVALAPALDHWLSLAKYFFPPQTTYVKLQEI